MVQYGVSIVNGTIHGIPIDVLEVWLILGFLIVYLPQRIKFDKLVLISFVFNEDRIVVETFVLKEQLRIRTISSGPSVFGKIFCESFVDLSQPLTRSATLGSTDCTLLFIFKLLLNVLMW